MIPEEPAHGSSDAELWMFRYLRTLPSGWFVLHSLGSVRHEAKPWSEIDFTIVGPFGVMLIEVKGGSVYRDGGTWMVKGGDGRVDSLGRGPVHQVGGSEAATRRFLQGRLDGLGDVTFGFSVAFPDCRFEINDMSIDQALIFDARDVARPSAEVIGDQFRWWRERFQRRGDLSETQVNSVVALLAGDVPMAPDLRRATQDVHAAMRVLTVEQERTVKEFSENRAIWVSGPAGAGKTLLALGAARAAGLEGRRVLLVCHTRALAELGKVALGDVPTVLVSTFDQLARSGAAPRGAFDTVFVDEAHDLMTEEFADFINDSLEGGLLGGVWRIFIDGNQGLFHPVMADARDRWMAAHPAMHRLSVNCRTTRPISITTSALSGVPLALGGVVEAPIPTLEFVADPLAGLSRAVAEARSFVAQGLAPADVAVLWPDHVGSTSDDLTGKWNAAFQGLPNGVHASSIGAFTGLEATAVMLAGVEEIRSAAVRKQLYVGCTRATVFLSLFLPTASRADVISDYARVVQADQSG